MYGAAISDRDQSASMVIEASKDNKGIRHIAGKAESKIPFPMRYSFHGCLSCGMFFTSENREYCALLKFFDIKKICMRDSPWDLKLILKTDGLANLPKVPSPEVFIKKQYPRPKISQSMFFGVNPKKQG